MVDSYKQTSALLTHPYPKFQRCKPEVVFFGEEDVAIYVVKKARSPKMYTATRVRPDQCLCKGFH